MRIFAALLTVAALAAATAHAQYPQAGKPIRLVVPFAPGGSSEIISRAFAQEMSKILGTNMYVENKGGAAGNIAMQEVKAAPADGYTVILGHVGTLAVNPAMFAKLPYDAEKDFIPVTMLVKVPNIVVVNAEKVAAKTLKEYIDSAKGKPNVINYGSAGNGSSGHSGDGISQHGRRHRHAARAVQRHRPHAHRPDGRTAGVHVHGRAAAAAACEERQAASAGCRFAEAHQRAA